MRRADSGNILIIVLLVITVLLALVALTVDVGFGLVTKVEAVKAAELSVDRSVDEMYVPDYQAVVIPPGDSPAIPGLDPGLWASQFREATSRDAARNLGALHQVGLDTAGGTPYNPDIQLNNNNLASGDIRIGNWNKTAVGPFVNMDPHNAFTFQPAPADILVNADLSRAMEVSVRRVTAPRVVGVNEGDDPIPTYFTANPIEIHTPLISKLDPAAVIGPGAIVPVSDGTTAVTGAMPLSLRHVGTVQRVRPGPVANITTTTWLTSNNPAMMVRVRVTRSGAAATGGGVPYAGTIYWVSYPGVGNNFNRVRRVLSFLGQRPAPIPGEPQTAPPIVPLNRLNNGPGQGDGAALTNAQMLTLWNVFFNPALNNRYVNRTWILPVVINGGANNRRVIGFVRVYCEAARTLVVGGNRVIELDLRMAPSCSGRNVGTFSALSRTTPPTVVPAAVQTAHFNLMWVTDVDGIRAGPRAFGVVCASNPADYHR
jgi:hypothetical protein